MKLLFLILFPFFSFAQQSTYQKGDSTWLTSSDTGKAKVYKNGNSFCHYKGIPYYIGDLRPDTFIGLVTNFGDSVYRNGEATKLYDLYKYDTIGPFWKQVSDLSPHYNPVMVVELYEVRVYKSPITQGRKEDGWPGAIPYHFAWLDNKKKKFYLAVWEDKTLATTTGMSLDEAIHAGVFNGCPVPNPTIKHKKK